MSERPSDNEAHEKRDLLKTVVLPIEDAICAEWGRPGMKKVGKLTGLSLLDVNPVDATATVMYDERLVTIEEIKRFLKECADHCRAARGETPAPGSTERRTPWRLYLHRTNQKGSLALK